MEYSMLSENNESMRFDVLVHASKSNVQVAEQSFVQRVPTFHSDNAQGNLRVVSSDDDIRALGFASAQRVVKAFGDKAID